MAKYTFQRFEKKFLLTVEQMDRLIPKFIEHGMEYDKYCVGGNIYTIYNIYFDDVTSSVIRRSIRKPKFKEKFRMRSYVVPVTGEEKVFLEIKRKVKKIVLKRRAVLTYNEALAYLKDGTRPETDDYNKIRMFNELDNYLCRNKVKPAIYLSYERIAFFDKVDKNFRITFDRNITTRRHDLDLAKGSYGEQLLHENERLMEVKITHTLPKWLSDILTEEKIFMSGFSKYGNEYRRMKGYEFTHLCDRHPLPVKYEKTEKQEQKDGLKIL
ncbi:MAG: VTC domain-containing protein [Oscillospiraceae bacterium]|nr:VTC domain-containing protein [Oscillospiraceae bacterium]